MSTAATDIDKASGRVYAIRGPVLDVEFAAGSLPPVNDALCIATPTGMHIAEVQSHVDARTVRAVALQTTSGLARGVHVEATGAAIMVPVGDAVLGRLLDATGVIGDGGAALPVDVPLRPIHRQPPPLDAQSTATTMFETGIKVIDLLAPSRKAARRRCSAAPGSAKPCW
ncbi:MAG: F-type H+-transporting ATPase subunit beta [Sphingomonas echinoides]|jgi:F-type H+-transporting ATPase subunit beta